MLPEIDRRHAQDKEVAFRDDAVQILVTTGMKGGRCLLQTAAGLHQPLLQTGAMRVCRDVHGPAKISHGEEPWFGKTMFFYFHR